MGLPSAGGRHLGGFRRRRWVLAVPKSLLAPHIKEQTGATPCQSLLRLSPFFSPTRSPWAFSSAWFHRRSPYPRPCLQLEMLILWTVGASMDSSKEMEQLGCGDKSFDFYWKKFNRVNKSSASQLTHLHPFSPKHLFSAWKMASSQGAYLLSSVEPSSLWGETVLYRHRQDSDFTSLWLRALGCSPCLSD